MAITTMITSYDSFIKDRWAGNGVTPTPADAVFDATTSIVAGIAAAPTWDVPDAAAYHGGMDDYPLTLTQLKAFLAIDIDGLMQNYWEDNGAVDILGAGIEQHEAALYEMWSAQDPAASAANVDAAVDAFLADSLDDLEDTLFPSAQGKFISSNLVFSSMYGEFVFNAYRKVLLATDKFRADLTTQQLNQGMTRISDMLKTVITRGIQYAQLRGDLMIKKIQFKMQFEELKTKLAGTTNQMILSDTINAEKAAYATEITEARWAADNLKYRFEAFAAIHGGLATGKKTEESGWDAMDGFQKTVAVASVAVSLGQGVAAMGKDMKWW